MTPIGCRTPWRDRLRRAAPYAATLAAGLWLYRMADQFAFERDPGRIGPDAWPKIILMLMMACAAWGLGTALMPRGVAAAATAEGKDEALISPPELHPILVWIGIGATFVYLLLLPRIGFLLATTLYAMILIWLGQYRNLRPILILGVVLSLSFIFLFMRVVYVPLPIGEGPFAQLSLAVIAAMGVH